MITKLNNKIIITTCVQLSSFTGMLPPPKYISKLHGVAAHPRGGDCLCLTFKLQHFSTKRMQHLFTIYSKLIKILQWGNFETDYDTNVFNYHRNSLEKPSPLSKSPKERKNIDTTSEALRFKNTKAKEKVCSNKLNTTETNIYSAKH